MFIILGATAHPTILFQKYRPKEPMSKNRALKNLSPGKQSKSTARLPLRPALTDTSNLIAKKRRRSIGRKSKTGKTLFWLPGTMPSRVKKGTRNATITRKKAILQRTAQNLEKTSVNLGNLRAGDRWWWGSHQDALHLLSGWTPGKLGAGKGFVK